MILAWLAACPPADHLDELGSLKGYLERVTEIPMQPLQRLRLLEVFQSRVNSDNSLLKPELVEAALPLSHRLRSIAKGLTDIHGLMASGYLRSIRELTTAPATMPAPDIPTGCTRVLQNLAEQQQISAFVSTAEPDGQWLQVQEVLGFLEILSGNDTTDAEHILKAMFALAAVQPESFPAAELAFLVEYLRIYAAAVDIRHQPAPPLEAWYWLEQSRDQTPIAIVRKPPPSHGHLIYYSCMTLGRIASQHLTQLSNGESIHALDLAVPNNIQSVRDVLFRAQVRWLSPARRQSHRRPNHYRVEICCQFNFIWQAMRGDAPADSGLVAPITEWMVLNESPSGLALMHIAGKVTELRPGDILAVRQSPEWPWSIYLLRWGRSDNPEHYELGVELVSTLPIPVHVIYARSHETKSFPALLCPPMTGIDRKEALLTASDRPDDVSFTLLNDGNGRLQVSECGAGRLVLKTEKVVMFELNREPSLN
jgi:cyclic-di-GMP-binding protein